MTVCNGQYSGDEYSGDESDDENDVPKKYQVLSDDDIKRILVTVLMDVGIE